MPTSTEEYSKRRASNPRGPISYRQKFITKTSSGKINRRTTGKHWKLAATENGSANGGVTVSVAEATNQIRRLFPFLDFDAPIQTQIDSLGLVNLSILLTKFGLRTESSKLETITATLARLESGPGSEVDVIRIVSLTDANIFRPYGSAGVNAFADKIAMPVQLQHVCAPPAEILPLRPDLL